MRKFRFTPVMAVSAVLLFAFVCSVQAQYVSEDFKDATAPDWTFINELGYGPALTGNGGIDPVGEGWLRLTRDDYNQNSFVYYNNSIPTKYGLVFNFDFVIWSTRNDVADGFTLVIFDADASPVAPGGWGGSLGYAQRSGVEGFNGGIVGFGFDTFGNYSNPTEGRIGGPGKFPNSIAIRGSMGATRYLGYEYVTGVEDLPDFATASADSRDDAVVHSVRLTITTDKHVTIEWKPAGGSWSTLLDSYACTLTCPDNVKFGYAASTGSVTSNQEIRNLELTPDSPECWDTSDCEEGEVCNDYTCEEGSLIELGSIDAAWKDDGIAVSWVTDAEIDNAYFNLYRAESIKTLKEKKIAKMKKRKHKRWKKGLRKGPYVQINTDPIPAEGMAPFGTSYELLDTDVQAGKRYWYILEDVDLYGESMQHGPCGPVSAWEDGSYMP